ncbi:peptidoglycan DD-metalloendopeptidase family protein [Bauldia sp.]|uniref:murein hydrolase activator EnvC family protein n=1 Tax=Bauldia sp. TaxID=2575872 RepID=UPI0025BA76A5|nr:peptidoglycan DD-metalloendopeptidase family protein [Bauldia sp.]
MVLAAVALAAPPALAAAEDPAEMAKAARAARQAELEQVARDIALTDERLAELRAEIEALDKDRGTLNQALIEAGKRVQSMEGRIGETETRIKALVKNEDALRASLARQRGVLGEVLAALQRIGRRPPPAILVRPEDALTSVRSAILLGAVVPDLRKAADKLSAELGQLVSLKNELARERDRMRNDMESLAEDRARTEFLIAERQKQRDASAAQLAEQERRATQLAEQATSLKDLIARMEKEVAAAARAKAEADAAAAKRREAAEIAKNRVPPDSLGESDRLAPAVAFADARGLLPLPASGKTIRAYGEADGLGNRSEGMSVATRPNAQVNAPSDGWIVYAGPFRSYGKLLIINAGDGYHVLLAGMDQINVQLGQFVLAGEPVAMMASPKLASAGDVDIVSTQPVLYIEFRKDGTSIDPAPWWAATDDEKVGG